MKNCDYLKIEPLICEQNPAGVEYKGGDSVAHSFHYDPLANVLQPAGVEGEAGLDGVVDGGHHAFLLNRGQSGSPTQLLDLKINLCREIPYLHELTPGKGTLQPS